MDVGDVQVAERPADALHFIGREVRVDIAAQHVDQLRDVGEIVELVALEFFDRQAFDLLLASDPARIAASIVAKTHIRNGLIAVHMRHPGLEVNVQMAPGIIVVQRFRYRDIDAADRIDQILCRVDPKRHIAIEVRASVVFRQAEKAADDEVGVSRTTVVIGIVDLVFVSVDDRIHVARYRNRLDHL